MKLPNMEKANVPRSKIVDYLLSASHPAGHVKVAFFRRLGFKAQEWEVLEQALRRHAAENEVAKTEPTLFGMRYVIEGPLQSAGGKVSNVRTVWFVEHGESVARFVTAYPLTWAKKAR